MSIVEQPIEDAIPDITRSVYLGEYPTGAEPYTLDALWARYRRLKPGLALVIDRASRRAGGEDIVQRLAAKQAILEVLSTANTQYADLRFRDVIVDASNPLKSQYEQLELFEADC